MYLVYKTIPAVSPFRISENTWLRVVFKKKKVKRLCYVKNQTTSSLFLEPVCFAAQSIFTRCTKTQHMMTQKELGSKQPKMEPLKRQQLTKQQMRPQKKTLERKKGSGLPRLTRHQRKMLKQMLRRMLKLVHQEDSMHCWFEPRQMDYR